MPRPIAAPILATLLCVIALGGGAVPAGAQTRAPFVTDRGQAFATLADAVRAVGGGEGVISIAPGLYRDCAVQTAGVVTYRATEPGSVIFDGGICEGKAALVLRGRGAVVSGIIFRNMAVVDGNGAGIRLETGDLLIDDSMFIDSQQGILTATDPAASLTIRRSTFRGLGRCDGDLPCAHSVYVGALAALTVERSRFEGGTGGHYVKSRAAVAVITDNSFDDSAGNATNYMIDLPNGASGRIERNEMVQGRNKDNYSAFIAIAAEGRERSSAGLIVAGNGAHFVPGLSRRSAFVADWGGEGVRLGDDNMLDPGITPYERR